MFKKRKKRINSRRNEAKTTPVKIQIVSWYSQEYLSAIELRNNSLNRPSGLTIINAVPLQEELAIHLVAIINNQVVGTLFLDKTDCQHIAQIKQVAVSTDYRGRKIGQQLMTYVEKIAAQQGYDQLILNARYSAWSFYEKLGYQAFGEQYLNGQNLMQPFTKKLNTTTSNLTSVA